MQIHSSILAGREVVQLVLLEREMMSRSVNLGDIGETSQIFLKNVTYSLNMLMVYFGVQAAFFDVSRIDEWGHGHKSDGSCLIFPQLPWILADYTSKQLNFDEPATFRDLSRPIGVANPENIATVREK